MCLIYSSALGGLLVTPALKRGLKPAGLLDAAGAGDADGVSEEGLSGCGAWGVSASFGDSVAGDLVIFASGFGVLASGVGASVALVTPALKRGLKPAGLLETAGAGDAAGVSDAG